LAVRVHWRRPCTDWLGKEIIRDENGFVLTGPDLLVDGQPPGDWPLERHPYFLEASVPVSLPLETYGASP